MEQESAGHLFVSYLHVDVSVMQMFRKHLQGMLRGRVQIWSDQGIARGAEWETIIKGSMTQANAAFVLASPDYLISQWCREELKALTEAYHSRRLRYLFWVQLRPCGWQHTELANFQSFAPSIEQAISEAPSDTQRDRLILQACEQIASEAISAVTEKDRRSRPSVACSLQADKPDLIRSRGSCMPDRFALPAADRWDRSTWWSRCCGTCRSNR